MSDTDEESHECPVCGGAFENSKGRGIHLGKSHSDEEVERVLLEEIDRLADKLGRPPTRDDMISMGRFSPEPYESRYGSWNDALSEVGYEPNHRLDIQDKELLTEINHLADVLDRPPTSDDMISMGRFSPGTYESRYGSWNEALSEAGYEPHVRRDIPSVDLLTEIDRLVDELGRPPTSDDMISMGRFSTGTYESRYGSWNEALREAGYEPHRIWGESRAGDIYYGSDWRKVSSSVRERDNGECRVCGSSTDNHHLEYHPVHHITPAREFGAHDSDVETDYEEMNDPSNLITLCPSCHPMFEGKWQDCNPDEFARRAREELEKKWDGIMREGQQNSPNMWV